MIISAKKYIKMGFSVDDAEKLDEILKPLIDKRENIVIDFEGVKFFTTLFFNMALSKYVLELGLEDYDKLIEVQNLSDVGKVTYKHSIDNAKEYYAMSEEQRKNHDKIVSEFE